MSNTPAKPSSFTDDAGIYSVLGWILFSLLMGYFATILGTQLISVEIGRTPPLDLFNAFWRAVLTGLPTLLAAFAVFDAARLFGRFSEDEVFTEANIKTLKSCGDSLVLAALASALISPTVLAWMDQDFRGVVWRLNDLAIAAFAMGVVIHGFASVMREAVRIKQENDEIV